MVETSLKRSRSVVSLALILGLALVALPSAVGAQDPVMKIEDSIVKVFGTTTAGAADILIFSGSGQDAILGMGEAPSFFGGNSNALVFGYNGNAEVGSGFIGTRPTSGSGSIGIFIKNTKEATFSSSGINLEAGNDYRVNGVALNVPDFVFEDSYSLMPLDQVARFVEDNKHLPDIPSQDEIKSGSLGLAGFQMKLLQKIEELTLYTLDQEKRIQELQRQLDEVKK